MTRSRNRKSLARFIYNNVGPEVRRGRTYVARRSCVLDRKCVCNTAVALRAATKSLKVSTSDRVYATGKYRDILQ